jgi:GT2 family glycosyltransferase
MKVSVISINYNSIQVTLDMISSVLESEFSGEIEIIIIDNNSLNDDLSLLEGKYPNIKLIKLSKNIGFAGGNNVGIKASTGDYIFLLNNDTEVEKNTIETLVNVLVKDNGIGAISPKILYHKSPHIIQYAGGYKMNLFTLRAKHRGNMAVDKGQFDNEKSTAYTHGAAMLVPRTVIEKVGLMFEDYFLYYEELDWCQRILEFGYKLEFCGQVKVFHKESISVGKNSPSKIYYLNRNRILYARRNLSKINFFISSLYLFFVSFPKNSIALFFENKQLLTAYLKAISWNLKNYNINYKTKKYDLL